jgi:hypothetical protein
MIDINAKHFTPGCGYTFIIEGNDIEEQLVTMISPGQGGRGSMMMVAIQIDGGMSVMYDRACTNDAMPTIFERELLKWATQGIRPDAAQLSAIKAKVQRKVKAFRKFMHCETAALVLVAP